MTRVKQRFIFNEDAISHLKHLGSASVDNSLVLFDCHVGYTKCIYLWFNCLRRLSWLGKWNTENFWGELSWWGDHPHTLSGDHQRRKDVCFLFADAGFFDLIK